MSHTLYNGKKSELIGDWGENVPLFQAELQLLQTTESQSGTNLLLLVHAVLSLTFSEL